MSDALVVIHSPFGPLALTVTQITEAQARARELLPAQQQPATAAPTEIATADEMARCTHTPVSWWLEAARRGTVPCLRIGKYPRFIVQDALAALHTASRADGTPQTPKNKRRGNGRYHSATSSGAP